MTQADSFTIQDTFIIVGVTADRQPMYLSYDEGDPWWSIDKHTAETYSTSEEAKSQLDSLIKHTDDWSMGFIKQIDRLTVVRISTSMTYIYAREVIHAPTPKEDAELQSLLLERIKIEQMKKSIDERLSNFYGFVKGGGNT